MEKTVQKKVATALKNYIFDSVLLIVLGLALILFGDKMLEVNFMVVGIVLIVIGVYKIAMYFIRRYRENEKGVKYERVNSVWAVIFGVIDIAAGVLLIVFRVQLVKFFPFVAAAILAYGAVIMIIRAIKLAKKETGKFLASLILGIIALVLAVIVFMHPAILIDVMTYAAGIAMIVEGIFLLIVLSFKEQVTDKVVVEATFEEVKEEENPEEKTEE